MKLHNIIWVCLLAFVLSGVQANAQFEDPRVLGGEKIRDLEPIYPNQEEVRPSGVKSAQSGFVFLGFSTDARRAAMADAGAGLIGDASGAVFLNPGLLVLYTNGRRFFPMPSGFLRQITRSLARFSNSQIHRVPLVWALSRTARVRSMAPRSIPIPPVWGSRRRVHLPRRITPCPQAGVFRLPIDSR